MFSRSVSVCAHSRSFSLIFLLIFLSSAMTATAADTAHIGHMATNADGVTLVSGSFAGRLNLGGDLVTARGESDLFFMIMDDEGALTQHAFGGKGRDQLFGVAVNAYGDFQISYGAFRLARNGLPTLVPHRLVVSANGEVLEHISLRVGVSVLGSEDEVLKNGTTIAVTSVENEGEDDSDDPVGFTTTGTVEDEGEDDSDDPVGFTSNNTGTVEDEGEDDSDDPVGFAATGVEDEGEDDSDDPVGFTSNNTGTVEDEGEDDSDDPVGFTTTGTVEDEGEDDSDDPVGFSSNNTGTVEDEGEDDSDDPVGVA